MGWLVKTVSFTSDSPVFHKLRVLTEVMFSGYWPACKEVRLTARQSMLWLSRLNLQDAAQVIVDVVVLRAVTAMSQAGQVGIPMFLKWKTVY